jgi:hypothetical protein
MQEHTPNARTGKGDAGNATNGETEKNYAAFSSL